MDRRGSSLLVTLVALMVVALAVTIYHHHAIGLLRTARASLAIARAREAAGAGLATAAAGFALTGMIPGGAHWTVTIDTVAPGMLLLRSAGSSTLPTAAAVEVAALLNLADSTLGGGALSNSPSAWVVIRPD